MAQRGARQAFSTAWLLPLLFLASPALAVPSFNLEAGPFMSSAAIQSAVGSYSTTQPGASGPGLRVYYVYASSDIRSAITSDGVTFAPEAGVRLSSRTVPPLDIAVSSITGCSALPLPGGGFRMLYSVVGATGTFRIYSATSADGLSWANDTGTRIEINGGSTFAGLPSLVQLGTGNWRLYYVQNSLPGNQKANHQIFTALSTNQGLSWSTGAVAVPALAGEVAASVRTDGRIRLYYTAPLSGATTDTTVLSALSRDANGTVFSAETGIRLSTSVLTSTLSYPFLARSTDTFSWRMYYVATAIGQSPGEALSAVTNAPDPQAIAPHTVFQNNTAVSFNISGEIFSSAPIAAALTQSGQPNIAGTALTRADDQNLSATFNTQNQNLGLWNLVVTNTNGLSTTLPNALLVDYEPGVLTLLDNLIRPRLGTRTKITVTIFAPGNVSLKVYTLNGEFLNTLLDAQEPAGTFSVFWDGRTGSGRAVASGVYLLRSKGPKIDSIEKIVVIK